MASIATDSTLNRNGSITALPDWLHPVVCLEMIRSVRLPGFILGYLLFQLFGAGVIVAMLHLGFNQLSQYEMKLWDTWFWWALAVPYLIVFPIAAYRRLRADIQRRLVEPMHLTRMNSYGILYGQWATLNMRGAVLACTLLPCLTLRYYAFGSNPLVDMLYLAELLMASSALCASYLAVAGASTNTERIWVMAAATLCWLPYLTVVFLYHCVMAEPGLITAYGDGAEIGLATGTLLYAVLGCRIALRVGSSYMRPYESFPGSYRRARDAQAASAAVPTGAVSV